MLGAIIGDIVGSRFEFNPTNDYNFELFTDECSFTDDTICTIAVADALLKGRDYGESIHEWCRRYLNPKGGYGGRFRQWVMSDHPQPYGSFGNGSAMRVSPIGWWFEHPHDLFEEAKKCAACTHNHEEGINGAQAVVYAIQGCRELRHDFGKTPEMNDILWGCLDHATDCYRQYPVDFKINIEDYRNKFDETCQGTVPPALWIVRNSTSFEDALRQAVSLGADADTIGAIVGSIAEALWGIPEWMKKKAMNYLPEEMKDVVNEFHERLNRLRKLTQRCQFYLVGDFRNVEDKDMPACVIEKEWAHDLAKSYHYADSVKEQMAKRWPLEQWQEVADNYDLPLSLIGYIARHTLNSRHKSMRCLLQFLEKHYACRKPQAEKKKAQKAQKEQFKVMMLWKLGAGHKGKAFNGEDPMPDKSTIATASMWELHPMPEEAGVSEMPLSIPVDSADMALIRRGHIPEAQEDHWFMYCDDEHIYYHRSWTGMCVFEAHYQTTDTGYVIDHLKMSHALAEFGVNGDEAGAFLFRYLVIAEIGADDNTAWNEYLNAWDALDRKYGSK